MLMRCQYKYHHNPEKHCSYEAIDGSKYCIFHVKKEFKDFRGLNLEEADLEDAYLVRAKLDDAKLTDATLTHANLEGASLVNVDLSHSKLLKANLHKANLFKADLPEANLIEANLTEANLTETNLRNSDMSGVHASNAILRDSTLANSDLSKAELNGANLETDDLSNCDLSYTNFKGANIKNAKAVNADFSYANLENADMREINAVNADFSHANLHNAILSKATLKDADFSYADLTGADFSDATMEDCIFHGANVKNVELKNAGVRYAREWEYSKNLIPLKNEKNGKEYEKNRNWRKAFIEFCYASKIYNDLSYYFKDRGRGGKEDEFLKKKWKMNKKAGKSLLKFKHTNITEEEKKLLLDVFSLSGNTRKSPKIFKIWIWLKIRYYSILAWGLFTDFMKVLLVSGIVIFIFSLLYWSFDSITSSTSTSITFKEALYFSIVTFTTLGYGDYYPKHHAAFQYLAASEAVLGMILMSLFVVTLYRRVVR